MMMKHFAILLAFLVTLSAPVAAQDLDKGLAAEQGDAWGQLYLGGMYRHGKGVLQDNTMAHMWYNISAANGNESGGTNRDKISKEMTPAAIEKAQAMARECMNSGYAKCGY